MAFPTTSLIVSGLAIIFAAFSPAVAHAHPPASAAEAAHTAPSAESATALEQQIVDSGLVDVQSLDPTLVVDLKYARADNFMSAIVYDNMSRAFLRPQAAQMLARANELLRARHPHLRILVADAFRPRSVQHRMWKLVVNTPQQPYVANPHKGSMHNYGAAVDVTLFDTSAGAPLDMGTKLDHFGPLAQPALEQKYLASGQLTRAQLDNRKILRTAMVEAGWRPLSIEWWHFDAMPKPQVRRRYTLLQL
jgi:D-alanyl-D-alanine dipeptidase